MKIKKILISLILICMSIFCMTGCAKIEMMRMVDSYHAIMDKIIITLDKKKLGSSYIKVRNSIQDDMTKFRNYVYEWIDQFEEDYTDLHRELSDGIICQEVMTDDHTISLILEFRNTYCFSVFYGVIVVGEEGNEYAQAMTDIGPFVSHMLKQEYKTDGMGLFLYKYSMINTDNLINSIKEYQIDGIGTNYYNKYSELMSGYTLDDVDISQVFAYPDEKIYSNADVKEVTDGFTFLQWDLSNKPENFQMSIYKIAPKTTAWYILALIVSVIAIIVLFVVIRAKKLKNNVEVHITKKEVEKNE